MKKSGLIVVVSILVLLFCCTFVSAAEISAVFESFNASNINSFQLNGNASLRGNSLRLTESASGKTGSAFWNNKLALANLSSFSAYFTFRIASPGGGGADGLVFTIQNESSAAGSSGGGMGYQAIRNAFGVEIDTWQNSEFSDPNANHIGIDVSAWNGSNYVGNVTSVANVSNPSGYSTFDDNATYHTWVEYNGRNSTLAVYINRNNNTRPLTALTTQVNLSNSTLASENYVGFTAATGGAWESHEIGSFLFNYDFIEGGINPNTTTYTSSVFAMNVSATMTELPVNRANSTLMFVAMDTAGNQVGAGKSVTLSTTAGSLNQSSATTNSLGAVLVVASPSAAEANATVRAETTGGVYKETQLYFYVDADRDLVPDARDRLIGLEQNVTTTGITSLNITVGGNITNGTYAGVKEVVFYDEASRVLNFSYNFSQSRLNLTLVSVSKDENSLVVNLSDQLPSTYTKTIFLEDNGFTTLCVKNAEVSNINQMSADCTGTNETDFTSCIGSATAVTIAGITCVDSGSSIAISNLSFSAVRGRSSSAASDSSSSSYYLEQSNQYSNDDFVTVKARMAKESKKEARIENDHGIGISKVWLSVSAYAVGSLTIKETTQCDSGKHYGPVYKTLSVDATLNDQEVDNLAMQVHVPKSWVVQNDIDRIIAVDCESGSELDVAVLGEEEYKVSADNAGAWSIVGIANSQKPVDKPVITGDVIEEVPIALPDSAFNEVISSCTVLWGICWYWWLLVLLILLIGYGLWRYVRRKKKR